jgi:hypothetical protein
MDEQMRLFARENCLKKRFIMWYESVEVKSFGGSYSHLPKNDKYFREDYRCSGRRLKGRFAIFSRKSISFAKACEEICFFDAT